MARCNGGCNVQDDFPVRLSAFGFRFSAFGFRLSAFGFRLSAFGFRLFGFSAFRLSGFPGSKLLDISRDIDFSRDIFSLALGLKEVSK